MTVRHKWIDFNENRQPYLRNWKAREEEEVSANEKYLLVSYLIFEDHDKGCLIQLREGGIPSLLIEKSEHGNHSMTLWSSC